MAEVLMTFTFKHKGRTNFRPFTDGQIWKVTLAETACKIIDTLRSGLYIFANRNNLSVSVAVVPEGDAVIVQMRPRT